MLNAHARACAAGQDAPPAAAAQPGDERFHGNPETVACPQIARPLPAWARRVSSRVTAHVSERRALCVTQHPLTCADSDVQRGRASRVLSCVRVASCVLSVSSCLCIHDEKVDVASFPGFRPVSMATPFRVVVSCFRLLRF